MQKTSLSNEELDAVLPVIDAVCAAHDRVDDPRLIELAPRYARDLPERIRLFLREYGLAGPSAFCFLSGFPVDDDDIGPTPPSAGPPDPGPPLRPEEAFFLLCASVIGAASALRDVVPVKELDSDTSDRLNWRTEDAADHVGLLCLRNDDDIATTMCEFAALDTSRIDVDVLFEPVFPVGSASVGPILYGDRERPYLCLDPDNTRRDQLPPTAASAFDALIRAIEHELSGVVLWPGDVVFIDNRRAVHGREPFQARYDGTDHWLKQLTITRRSP
jgi:hypothetical protein